MNAHVQTRDFEKAVVATEEMAVVQLLDSVTIHINHLTTAEKNKIYNRMTSVGEDQDVEAYRYNMSPEAIKNDYMSNLSRDEIQWRQAMGYSLTRPCLLSAQDFSFMTGGRTRVDAIWWAMQEARTDNYVNDFDHGEEYIWVIPSWIKMTVLVAFGLTGVMMLA